MQRGAAASACSMNLARKYFQILGCRGGRGDAAKEFKEVINEE